MSKKSFTFLVIIVIAIIAAGGWYLYSRNNQTNDGQISLQGDTSVFPFGEGGSTVKKPTVTSGQEATTTTVIDISGGGDIRTPRLRQVSGVPTAGIVAFNVGSTTVIRYMERAAGHISETRVDMNPIIKISNATIPKVHEALWSSDGKSVVIRYLREDNSTIRTFLATVSSSTKPEKALEGAFLSDKIEDISVLGSKLFYFDTTLLGSQGIVSEMNGTKRVSVLSSSFGDWRSAPSGQSLVTIFDRPSAGTEGSAYILDTRTGNYSKIVGGVKGLVANANTDGTYAIFSGIQGGLQTAVMNIKTGKVQNAGISTIADKCVWSRKHASIAFCAVPRSIPGAAYPDDWYKGKVSFNDSIWRIDASTGTTEDILDPDIESGAPMDIINLGIDQNETALVFINKKDMGAWSFMLSR